MKKAVFIFFALFAITGIFAQQQPVVAVAPFDVISGVSATDAAMITDVFFVRLGNTRKVDLVNRAIVQRVIKEHNFQLEDWSNKDKTAELGKALNADWIVQGDIRRMNNGILIIVQFYSINTFKFEGGTDLRLANADEAYEKMNPLVDSLIQTIGSTGRMPSGNRPSISGQAVVPNGMVRIEGGTFIMGSPTNETGRGDDEIQHRVTVNSFYMGKYLVTQKEYLAIMGVNPGVTADKGDNFPVMQLDWYDAIEYCNRLSLFEGLTPAYMIDKNRSDPNNKNEHDKKRWRVIWDRDANGYRLPTEAEWEYACRAGTTTPYSFGINITGSLANYHWSDSVHNHDPTPVGKYPPNQWGLYDMHGNVWEWCWDWYGDYSEEAKDNPSGPVSGTFHVLRGGSWRTNKDGIRSAYRLNQPPWYIYENYGHFDTEGFRVVRN
jgi:formylglycine-generating enzyme required for sulfatase activity/TolB-like protein